MRLRGLCRRGPAAASDDHAADGHAADRHAPAASSPTAAAAATTASGATTASAASAVARPATAPRSAASAGDDPSLPVGLPSGRAGGSGGSTGSGEHRRIRRCGELGRARRKRPGFVTAGTNAAGLPPAPVARLGREARIEAPAPHDDRVHPSQPEPRPVRRRTDLARLSSRRAVPASSAGRASTGCASGLVSGAIGFAPGRTGSSRAPCPAAAPWSMRDSWSPGARAAARSRPRAEPTPARPALKGPARSPAPRAPQPVGQGRAPRRRPRRRQDQRRRSPRSTRESLPHASRGKRSRPQAMCRSGSMRSSRLRSSCWRPPHYRCAQHRARAQPPFSPGTAERSRSQARRRWSPSRSRTCCSNRPHASQGPLFCVHSLALGGAERVELAVERQPLERLELDLPHPLPCQSRASCRSARVTSDSDRRRGRTAA